VFNRPDTTERVFSEIAKARPPKLLVVADGPRPNRPGEQEKCAHVRALIERVNWDCEVLTNYSDVNLGCKRRVSSGLDWVFQNAEEAIILEDDCLPHPCFFPYVEQLLDKFRHDERVMHIGGVNLQFGRRRTDASFYFSRYNHIWGWATWRRAWAHYDVKLSLWPSVRDGGWLNDVFGNPAQAAYWSRIFQKVYDGLIDTWDYQWTFSCWMQNGLAVLPSVNLISNIGFRSDATHTREASMLGNIPLGEMRFPLVDPMFFVRDAIADGFTERLAFDASRIKIILRKVRGLLKKGG